MKKANRYARTYYGKPRRNKKLVRRRRASILMLIAFTGICTVVLFFSFYRKKTAFCMEADEIVRLADADAEERSQRVAAVLVANRFQEARDMVFSEELDVGSALIEREDEILFSYRMDEQMYPASMTKLLTALVAIHYGNLDDMVMVRDLSGASCNSPGSVLAGLREGDQLKLRDLLGIMLVYSGNDAASAIALHISGSESAFAELSNEYARELGATHTHFVNPNGLHDEDHYTSASDMMIFIKAAVADETLLSILETPVYTCQLMRNGVWYEESYDTTSQYLNGNNSIEGYTYIAGKTGYTGEAGRCFTSCFEKDGSYYYSVIMKSNDYVEKTTELYEYVTAEEEPEE